MKVENSPDRHLLQPTVEEVAALREQSQPFSWRISEEFFLPRRQFLKAEDDVTPDAKQGSVAVGASDSPQLVSVLEKSIAKLDREFSDREEQPNRRDE